MTDVIKFVKGRRREWNEHVTKAEHDRIIDLRDQREEENQGGQ